jgi:putative DNA primase/helicase
MLSQNDLRRMLREAKANLAGEDKKQPNSNGALPQAVSTTVVHLDASHPDGSKEEPKRSRSNGSRKGSADFDGGQTENASESIKRSRYRPLSLADFFKLTIKPRGMILGPIIPEKGLAMIYASRGTGKTYLALGIAYAVATGTEFLRWKAPKARRVLLVDGEMPAAALQERLAKIVKGATAEPADDMLQIISGDLIEEQGVGNLADPAVQAELDPHLKGIDLLILDNLSSLTAVIRDNDAESWNTIQSWLLRLRRRGISVLIVHHAGKGGDQRGTSRREDVLDTSISLRRPSDYVPTEGARFEVHLEKARGVHGDAAMPFEAKLEVRDDAVVWTTRDIDDVNAVRVKALLDDGLSVRDIADETGISKSTVQRIKKKAETGGSNG